MTPKGIVVVDSELGKSIIFRFQLLNFGSVAVLCLGDWCWWFLNMGVQRKMPFEDEDIHCCIANFGGWDPQQRGQVVSPLRLVAFYIWFPTLFFLGGGFQYCISQKGCQNQSTKLKDFHFSCSRLGLFRVVRFLEITLDLGSSCCLAFQIQEYLGHKNLGRNPNFGDVGKNLSSWKKTSNI